MVDAVLFVDQGVPIGPHLDNIIICLAVPICEEAGVPKPHLFAISTSMLLADPWWFMQQSSWCSSFQSAKAAVPAPRVFFFPGAGLTVGAQDLIVDDQTSQNVNNCKGEGFGSCSSGSSENIKQTDL